MDSAQKRSKQGLISPAVNDSDAPGTGNQASTGKTVTTVDCLPLEMLQCILEFGGNTNALKARRLVSRSWNEVCCQILRKVSAVPLNLGKDEGEDYLEKFKDLLLDREAEFGDLPSKWPNPFQNFKLVKTSQVSPPLVRFLKRRNVKVTTLEIIHDGEGFEPPNFGSILEQIRGDLIHLKIRSNSDSSAPFLTLTENLSGGGWKSLKTLTLKDTCTESSKPCPHVEFIMGLKANLKLERINLEGELVNVSRIFEGTDKCWDQLTRLVLDLNPPPPNVTPEQIHKLMKWAEEIRFPPLTHLTMWFSIDEEPEETSELYASYFLQLIQRSSPVLQDLRVNFMPLRLLPSLPKLKFLSCAVLDGDRVQDITEEKFPSLTSFYCHLHWTEIPPYVSPKESESNENILRFTIFWSNATIAQVVQELLWAILKEQFPNLETIDIKQSITSATMYVINKRFPGVSSIHLRTATASELLGTSSLSAFTAKGWPCEVYENCALTELTELTQLGLGEFVKVSKDVITACLGKLSNIRTLSFHWNNSIKPSDVSEHLGHIQNMTIFFSDKQQKQELEKLAKSMKHLKLVRWYQG